MIPIKHFSDMDQLDKIIAFEQGELQDCEIIDLFQELVNTGLAWELQGKYGRFASYLIQEGLISATKQEEDK